MGVDREKPQLRVVGRENPRLPTRGLDPITRESHIRMIRHLSRRYRLQVLVDQAIFGFVAVEDLPDDRLVGLHRDLDRARECLADGISLEDAGLIRSIAPLEACG